MTALGDLGNPRQGAQAPGAAAVRRRIFAIPRRAAFGLAIVACLALGACAGHPGDAGAESLIDTHPDLPSSHAAYLIALVAQDQHDYGDAYAFYQAALAQDPTNGEIASHVFVLAIITGKLDVAKQIAPPLLSANPHAPLVNLLTAVEAMKAGQMDDARAAIERLPRQDVYRLIGALGRAWLATDKPGGAEAGLREVESIAGFGQLAALHRALIHDQAGDVMGAEVAYRRALGDGVPVRVVELAANFFDRTGQPAVAAGLYPRYVGESAAELGLPLAGGVAPAPLVPDAAAGFAEALFDLANLMNGADASNLALLTARLAIVLRPDLAEAHLALGQAFEGVGRPDLAEAIYTTVDPKTTLGWSAALRVAALKQQAGDSEGARTDLRQLAAEHADRPEPLVELGNSLSADKRYAEAIAAYNAAFARIANPDTAGWWGLYYTRGTAYERASDWPKAESDLRKALALQPNQPVVMNYLGYSMVDRGDRLPEALKLIKAAVSQRPDDGFIVDSLGWAYFRMGDFKNAETTLEHAVELKPADPEINAHLGDAYWQGGRRDEARLQWRRALGLNPDPELARAIEAKLDRPAQPRAKPAKRGADAAPAATQRNGG